MIVDVDTTEVATLPTLDDLADQIRTAHAHVERALKTTLAHALHAGELLMQAKDQVKHGDWQNWLADRCELSESTSRRYVRLAATRQTGIYSLTKTVTWPF